MNHRLALLSTFAVMALLLVAGGVTAQEANLNTTESPLAAVGTSFTYQGRLDFNSSPASGTYDFRFRLFDDADAGKGTQLGVDEVDDVQVTNGLFSVDLDFGNVFDGTALWLEIDVRPGSSTSAYTTLSPLQAVNPTPYALYARSIPLAGNGSATSAARSDHSHQWSNVVVVAKGGGDYTSVQAAINSITDASEDNPYLVWVAPGEYEEAVIMKPYVHLQGAGQETTVISSTVSNSIPNPIDNATLVLNSHVTVRDLEIVNTGDDSDSVALLVPADTLGVQVSDVKVAAVGNSENSNIAIFVNGGKATLRAVTARSENAGTNASLYNSDGGIVSLEDCYLYAWGGDSAYGIYNTGTGTVLVSKNTDVDGINATDRNIGLYNRDNATAVLEGGSFIGIGSNDVINGIHCSGSSTLEAKKIYSEGRGSLSSNGVKNENASVNISHSDIYGEGHAINIPGSGTTYISFSTILGEKGLYNGTYACTAMIWDNDFIAETCP
jgi:hypothetical protein